MHVFNDNVQRAFASTFIVHGPFEIDIETKKSGTTALSGGCHPAGQDRERLYSWIEFASVNDSGCSGAKRISLPFVASTVPVPAPPPTPAPIAAPLPPPAMAPIAAPSPAPPAIIPASRFLVDSATSL